MRIHVADDAAAAVSSISASPLYFLLLYVAVVVVHVVKNIYNNKITTASVPTTRTENLTHPFEKYI